MKPIASFTAALITVGLGMLTHPSQATESTGPSIERGRYVAIIGGCNDCHTPGYAMKNGDVPEKLWLTGDILGWRGPWGTTYPTNLRLHFARLTEDQWVAQARTLIAKPPMPWFNVRKMDEGDLRALYRYVRSLGAPGKAAPVYLPPDRTPVGPVIAFPSAL